MHKSGAGYDIQPSTQSRPKQGKERQPRGRPHIMSPSGWDAGGGGTRRRGGRRSGAPGTRRRLRLGQPVSPRASPNVVGGGGGLTGGVSEVTGRGAHGERGREGDDVGLEGAEGGGRRGRREVDRRRGGRGGIVPRGELIVVDEAAGQAKGSRTTGGGCDGLHSSRPATTCQGSPR